MKHVDSIIAECRRVQERKQNAPVALHEMVKEENEAYQLVNALMAHYLESLGRGRLDTWAKAAHAVVDLLAHPNLEIHKRSAGMEGSNDE